MNEDGLAALAAFLDGEATDADVVAAVLATGEGQAALVGLALLKVAVRQDRPSARPEFVRAAEQRLAAAARRGRVLAWPRVTAAAGVVAAALGGFRFGESRAAKARQLTFPTSAHVVHFERGVDWGAR
jgi:hypothetical protein